MLLFAVTSGWAKVHHFQGASNERPDGNGRIYENYGSPSFNNPNYYYAAVKTAPPGVFYRQAGLSPDGTKLIAQKSYTDGSYSRTEIFLMNADGSGETIISAGNSGQGDIYGYMNPFWSDDGSAIGFAEVHNTSANKIVRYVVSSSTSSYIYEPSSGKDACNPDFVGSSTTTIVFWDWILADVAADLFIWDGSTLTNITNSVNYSEYEPVSNSDGTVILYWSGETTTEPVNTTHTLTYSGVWTKDVGFTPIADSYWPFWSTRADNYIGVTVMSTKDVHIYSSTGSFVMDLTGPGYSGGAGQWNFIGFAFEGLNGEIVMTTNAGRSDAGRDIVFAAPRIKLYVNVTTGNDNFPGTVNAPFATIGKAITESVSSGTINVASGTYAEYITVNKSVTLNGANVGIHPAVGTHPTETVGSRGAESILSSLSPAADNITIDGFKFSKAGTRIIDTYADADNFTLKNCIVESTSNGPSTGIIQFGGGSHTGCIFEYNLFQDKGDHTFYAGGGPYDGLQFNYNKFNAEVDAIFWAATPLVNGVFRGNEMDGTVGGVPGVGYGTINIGQAGNMQIYDNWFHDMLYTPFQVGIFGGAIYGNKIEHIYPMPGSFADAMQLWGGQWGTAVSTNVNIYDNIINYNDIPGALYPSHGLRLRAPETGSGIDGSTIHVYHNKFLSGGARLDAYAVRHQGNQSTYVDAEDNYWGTTNASQIAVMFNTPVDYDPWCNADFSVCGFTSSSAFYNVTDGMYFTTLQNAINAASNNDVIQIMTAGTYGGVIYNTGVIATVTNSSGGVVIIQGASPALTVSSGTVTYDGINFTTATNDPTILVNGGNLILLNCTITESTRLCPDWDFSDFGIPGCWNKRYTRS